MLTKTRALVLRTVKYGESKLIADLLTEEIGRVGIVANIPQSSRGRAARAFFQPLTLLDIEIDYRQTMQLQKYRNVSNLLPYTSLTMNPVKTCIVMFLSEFLYHVTRDEQQNHALFSYIVNSLEWLDAKEDSFANSHLVFMMRLAKFIGFSPNLDGYCKGCYFDLRSGCFETGLPYHGDVVLADEARVIVTLTRMNYENMHLFSMSRTERNRCMDVVLKYYTIHVPNFPELKSLEVLRSLFS